MVFSGSAEACSAAAGAAAGDPLGSGRDASRAGGTRRRASGVHQQVGGRRLAHGRGPAPHVMPGDRHLLGDVHSTL